LAHRDRFSYSRIQRALFGVAKFFGLLGLAFCLSELTINHANFKFIATTLGYALFFLLALVLTWNPAVLARKRKAMFERYWARLAEKHASRVLRKAKKAAPYCAEYDLRGDLAVSYRSRDGKSDPAWTRRLSGYHDIRDGFTLLYKTEKSPYPYALIFHGESAELHAYLNEVGMRSLDSAADEKAVAIETGAEAVSVPAQSPTKSVVTAAFFLVLLYAAISWGPRMYFTPNKDAREIELFTTTWCGYCAQLKAFLNENRIPFRETDVEHSYRGYFAQKGLGPAGSYVRGVPFATIGPEVVYGLNKARIEKAVGALGYRVVKPFEGNPAVDGDVESSRI
jgi:glutaredoxin